MSSFTNLLTRPSTMGAIGVVGTGSFWIGLKYRTLTRKDTQEKPTSQEQNYEVKPGRSGGGV
ncbi:hypothetical protein ACLMJK_003548 [Lecanora helva]